MQVLCGWVVRGGCAGGCAVPGVVRFGGCAARPGSSFAVVELFGILHFAQAFQRFPKLDVAITRKSC